jgi:hypothetical protein
VTETEFKKIMSAPRFEKNALEIIAKRIFTDVNGVIVDKAAVPAALQTEYPVYVFGQYDRNGAYWLAQKNTPARIGYEFIECFVFGAGLNNPAYFTALGNIQGQLKPGDLVTLYADSYNAPNYYIWIVQRCSNNSLAAILANLPNLPYDPDYGYINIVALDYYVAAATAFATENQWNNDLLFMRADFLGDISSDSMEPKIFKSARSIQNGFVAMRYKTRLDQYLSMNTYINFETDSITFTFQVEHQVSNFKTLTN